MSADPIPGWEDLSRYGLDDHDVEELLGAQRECTLIWVNKGGHPLGAIVNYIHRRGSLWLTATSKRPRVAAVRANPKVSIVISSKGSGITSRRSLTYKGICTVHEDEATKQWLISELSAAMRPGDPERAREFAALLDSPLRVVLEVKPISRTGYDGGKMWAAAPTAGPADGEPGFDAERDGS